MTLFILSQLSSVQKNKKLAGLTRNHRQLWGGWLDWLGDLLAEQVAGRLDRLHIRVCLWRVSQWARRLLVVTGARCPLTKPAVAAVELQAAIALRTGAIW
jgi:hypothetical protein